MAVGSPVGGREAGARSPALGPEVGTPVFAITVSPPRSGALFAGNVVGGGLVCNAEEAGGWRSTGEDGSCESCSLVFFFLRNPRVGMDERGVGSGQNELLKNFFNGLCFVRAAPAGVGRELWLANCWFPQRTIDLVWLAECCKWEGQVANWSSKIRCWM